MVTLFQFSIHLCLFCCVVTFVFLDGLVLNVVLLSCTVMSCVADLSTIGVCYASVFLLSASRYGDCLYVVEHAHASVV